MSYLMGVFIFIALVFMIIIASIVSQKRFHEETLSIYHQLAEKRNGRISKLPFKLGAMDSLEIPIEGGKAYLIILSKEINFFVVSSDLRECILLWIKDAKTISPGSIKLGNAPFDKMFRIWRGPREIEVIQNTFNTNCQQSLLALKEEVTKNAVNIFIELIHTKPRDDTLTIKMDNYLVKRRLFQVELDNLHTYLAILDKCIKVYEVFKRSGECSPKS